MIIVTVARRPLSESTVASNVLAHGTGALNIDACRIGTSESDREEMLKMSRGFVGRKFGRPEMMNYGYEESMPSKTLSVPAPSRRWPANLILGHLDGCSVTGSQRVKSHKGGVRNPALGIMNDDSWKPSVTADRRDYLDADGMETVPAWNCAAGCPVAELDAQSGESKSSGGRIGNKDGGLIYGGGKGLVGTYEPGDPGYGDTGTASRFFKQVGGLRK